MRNSDYRQVAPILGSKPSSLVIISLRLKLRWILPKNSPFSQYRVLQYCSVTNNILLSGRCGWEGQRKSEVTCNMFIFSFLGLLSLMQWSSVLWRFSRYPCAPPETPVQHRTAGQHPSLHPHPPLKPQTSVAGPTMCSTSRAVYLLIASLTIAHNNQLRHCQRNTHSWHRARREVRTGCSSSSFLLIHRRQESGDKQRLHEATAAVLKKTAFKQEKAQNHKLPLTPSLR